MTQHQPSLLTFTLIFGLIFNGLVFGVTLPEGISEDEWLQIRKQINVGPYFYKSNAPDKEEQLLLNIAISGDTLVVGAPAENGDKFSTAEHQNNNAANTGAAYVFKHNGHSWHHQAYLKASNVDDFDMFGYSVAISGDTIVIGALQEDGDHFSTATDWNDDSDDTGAVYVFSRNGNNWIQEAYLKSSNAGKTGPAQFGYSVAIDANANIIAIGAPYEFTNSNTSNTNRPQQTGAAYVFSRENGGWNQQAHLKASNAAEGDEFGRKVAIRGETLTVEVRRSSGNDAPDETDAVYIFTRDNQGWRQTHPPE